jgi:hypothetical protein
MQDTTHNSGTPPHLGLSSVVISFQSRMLLRIITALNVFKAKLLNNQFYQQIKICAPSAQAKNE